ncbi:hypothetical protein H8A97_25505 [Bradyrhizobium sp. Arg62]|uniref:hypothetical protein n=1 Tax=Bradyrhizobium brasilense TaxID=1419277 RepID=UPI001E302158|nr:hypothetical protein [Bradyrhizobium brasilense]MCC8948374.1 hypothetical protein [Bradyrhizobium brasilense]
MAIFFGLIGTALVGAAGWFATSFVAAPIRAFFDLRKDARRQFLVFDERETQVPFNEHGIEVSAQQRADTYLAAAKRELRETGAKIVALGESEQIAAQVLKLFGYDAILAGENLMIAAETLGAWGPEGQAARKQAEITLRLRKG